MRWPAAEVDGETESAQYDCLVEQLGWAADRLSEQGVRLATEMLNPVETPGFLLSSLDRSRSTLAQLDGRVAFQLDVYHLQRTHGDLIPTIREMAERPGTTRLPMPRVATSPAAARSTSATSSPPSRPPATRGWWAASTGPVHRARTHSPGWEHLGVRKA